MRVRNPKTSPGKDHLCNGDFCGICWNDEKRRDDRPKKPDNIEISVKELDRFVDYMNDRCLVCQRPPRTKKAQGVVHLSIATARPVFRTLAEFSMCRTCARKLSQILEVLSDDIDPLERRNWGYRRLGPPKARRT